MHKRATAFAAVVSCVVVAGCANTAGHAVMPKATPSLIPRPVVEHELGALLLDVNQVRAAMGAPMAVTAAETSMSDNSATMAPPQCLALDGAAEADVYAGSGFQAEHDQSFNDGDKFTHYLKEAVVLYPLVDKAAAFLEQSAQQWRNCHAYTHTQSHSKWSVGQITYANGALSTTVTEQDAAAPGWGCGRAMTLRNNVVIDVNTCSADPADSALRIANQIAQTVAARW
ncbi:MAG: hypothetical protein QOK02_1697 [Mycobacterium sp.]|nr:hypothetical protein [Mycobacterium sp.]